MIDAPARIPDFTRLKAYAIILLLMFGSIIARLWYLQIVKGAELAKESETLRTRTIRRLGARGVITDAKGRVLASSRPHYVVSVLPDEIKKNPEVLPLLAKILETEESTLRELMGKNKITPFDPVPVARDVTMTQLSRIEEQKFDLPGVLITRDPKREYRDNKLCTHVLGITRPISAEKWEEVKNKGYLGSDYIGVEGLEAYYEDELRGGEGGQVIEVNAQGRMTRVVGENKPQPGNILHLTPGNILHLTLDLDLQRVTYKALYEQWGKGHAGAAVALDPNDGAVLAFVSLPSYDLNRYGVDFAKLVSDRTGTPLVNRASYSAYPCGSPFKLVTSVAGLETGAVTPYTTFGCGGSIRRGRTWRCDVRSGHGAVNFPRSIGASCNVYLWLEAERVGEKSLTKWANRLGFGERTGIDLPPAADTAGTIPTESWKQKRKHGEWYLGDTLNLAIGQGYVQTTPLQLALMSAAFANGGDLLRPQLVREIVDISSGKPVVKHTLKREVRRKVGWKPETRDAVVEGMRRAMQPGGTASALDIPGISIAAKTGTAQSGGNRADHSIFVCFAPVENPKIAIAVFVEHGGWGASNAGPIARRMLMQYFKKNVQIAAQQKETTPPPRRSTPRYRRR
jgi:penicillin-binding protein 2